MVDIIYIIYHHHIRFTIVAYNIFNFEQFQQAQYSTDQHRYGFRIFIVMFVYTAINRGLHSYAIRCGSQLADTHHQQVRKSQWKAVSATIWTSRRVWIVQVHLNQPGMEASIR